MRSCRKFRTEHLNEGGLKEKGGSHILWSKRKGKAIQSRVREKRSKSQKFRAARSGGVAWDLPSLDL